MNNTQKKNYVRFRNYWVPGAPGAPRILKENFGSFSLAAAVRYPWGGGSCRGRRGGVGIIGVN